VVYGEKDQAFGVAVGWPRAPGDGRLASADHAPGRFFILGAHVEDRAAVYMYIVFGDILKTRGECVRFVSMRCDAMRCEAISFLFL
jgi:hypothetical protein